MTVRSARQTRCAWGMFASAVVSALLVGGCPLPPADDGQSTDPPPADNDNSGQPTPGSPAPGGTDADPNTPGKTGESPTNPPSGDGAKTTALAPRIAAIPDVTIQIGAPYTGRTPRLNQGTAPITWSLAVRPAGMTVSASTGIVTWANPAAGLHPIVLVATGPGGVDAEAWILIVEIPALLPDVALGTVGSAGGAPDEESQSASLSDDSRYVVFSSQATNLVPGDALDVRDVFLRDLGTGVNTRISVGLAGEADGPSLNPVISGDGNFVAYQSNATNLVADDTNAAGDIFVWNRINGAITRVSVHTNGDEGSLSSENASISAEGRYVVFESVAPNLVDDDGNDMRDVFMHDRDTGDTWRISVDANGEDADGGSFDPVVSADGAYVVFASAASDLVADDTNGMDDIFLHTVATGATVRISHGAGGAETDGDSAAPHVAGTDARFVVFESRATNITAADVNGVRDVFLYDGVDESIVAVSVLPGGLTGDSFSRAPMVSADGRYVAFDSSASDLVADDENGTSDVFLRDMWTGTTWLWSASRLGEQGNAGSSSPWLTPDGKSVAFESKATNLVEVDDPIDVSNIFVRSQAE